MMFKSLKRALGLGEHRDAPAPRYLALGDGLLFTEHAVEAWFTLQTSNTDIVDADEQDRQLADVIAACQRALADKQCHVKVLWGRLSGAAYLEDSASWTTRSGHTLVKTRAERIDDLGLPQRHVLIGITLGDRNRAGAGTRAGEVVRGTLANIPQREIAWFDGQMQRIGKTLLGSPWRALPASRELIAWMIGREQHRTIEAAPNTDGLIVGPSLARLARGRVEPWTDHLRVYDAQGHVSAYVGVLMMPDFPDEMTTPGNGEWLRTLSEVTRLDVDGDEIPVVVDASVRFKLLTRSASLKMIDETRQTAKEQRRSAAKHSAEETSDEIEATESEMRQLTHEIKRDGTSFAAVHPLMLVTESSYAELMESMDAVIAHYADLGIGVEIAADEQREGWLQALPGDRVRISDMGHKMDTAALFGAWWWGGSEVGDDSGPAIGIMTGSTPGIVRNSIISGSRRGDATTTAFIGRSGRGKTTAMMLSLIDAVASGAWATMLDIKGDCTGAVAACHELDLPADLVTITGEHAGAADLLRVLPAQQAVLQVHGQLMLLTPPHMRAEAEGVLLSAINTIAGQPNPSTWAVIQHLKTSTETFHQHLGAILADYALTPLAATVVGEPRSETQFATGPGLHLIQFEGIQLPGADSEAESWTIEERVSVAVLRGFLAWAMHTAQQSSLRAMPKVVGVPEVHLLTATTDGRKFLDYIARVGRALSVNLAIDTQDPQSINQMQGIVEQIVTVFAFSQNSKPQQDALAELIGQEPSPHSRNLIRWISTLQNGEIRHGHCIMRDWRHRAAAMQWDFPNERVRQLLSTTPDETKELYDDDED